MKKNIISTSLFLILGYMGWTGIQMYWYPYDQYAIYSGPGMVGQPALIFSTPYFNANKEQILKMTLKGRAHHSVQNGVIYTDMEGITTAKQLIERVLVFVESSTVAKIM